MGGDPDERTNDRDATQKDRDPEVGKVVGVFPSPAIRSRAPVAGHRTEKGKQVSRVVLAASFQVPGRTHNHCS